jgi:hypothetical protein
VGITGHNYGQEVLTMVFSNASSWTFAAYAVFICVCVITTLDSGYIALKWFLQSNASTSNHPIFSLVPPKLLTSPIPAYLLSGLIALAGVLLRFELRVFHDLLRHIFCGLLDPRDRPLLHREPGECDSSGEDVLHRQHRGGDFLLRLLPALAEPSKSSAHSSRSRMSSGSW